MDKRLSVLIKEIKKSSKTSSSSIVNLIKLELADNKKKEIDKKKTEPVKETKIVSIASVPRVDTPRVIDTPAPTVNIVEESIPKVIDMTPKIESKLEVENKIDKPIERIEPKAVEIVDTPKVSEELKRVAMTGMKLTRSTKTRQKEYSRAKRAEDKKHKAQKKLTEQQIKEKAKDPSTPFGALSLSMDRLDEEMKLAMEKIGQDITDIKTDFPVFTDDSEDEIETPRVEPKIHKFSKENMYMVEDVEPISITGDLDLLVDTTTNANVDHLVENIEVVEDVLTEDIKEDIAKNETIEKENVVEENIVVEKPVEIKNTTKNENKKEETSLKAKNCDTYDIAKFRSIKGERKMDRAYDLTKVNQYAKILDEVSAETKSAKNKTVLSAESTETNAKLLLKDVKAVPNTAIELKPMRVLYVCSECQPFIATGGLADVAGSLPEAIKATNPYADMRVIMPLYSDIKEEYRKQFEYVTNFTVHLAWRQLYCGIFKFVKNNVTYYFLDNESYFKRKGSYGYYDDGERYAFFSKAVVEALPVLDYFPHIMHCNDWQSALCSIYIKTGYFNDYRFAGIKHIFTIHNIQYQGRFGKETLVDLFGIDHRYTKDLEYDGDVNLVKCAIQYSNFFTTVSPSYCDDLKQIEHSYGLHHEVRRQENKLRGILNGIDYNFYSPSVDPCIYKHYDIKTIDSKVENKIAIQKEYGLPVSTNTPLIVMATRLVSHKGLDLISRIMDEALKDDIQFMIVGTGDDKYIEYFKNLEARHKTKVKALVGQYSNPIARKLYAAGDIYVMPSKNEPCGLSQMISSIYGCVPIVRETGGLKDSIKDFGCSEGGNGYTFKEYNAHDLLYSIRRAVKDFKDRKAWKEKMVTVMKVDFSWSKPAKDYLTLYNQLV